ncbi:LuxR family transcriptional regulator [Amycolatopsis sp. WQ 127309]|uniref:helix-turn-helix transcriptional regulator n=1 Tax=Amycolatopsis sp. WQ 127309 TaxID=2932773 RepID=UPI001FF1A6B8|nr:LuxR family transcriptional regulator [Amycolatopsis sp. WQ 127309]UOZ06194.1 LuxR C-terminal-related transcriptional regulator [Amycolatopsis sp. WQ 127309]
MTLADLGLDATAERAYRHCLRDKTMTAAGLAEALHLDRAETAGIVRELVRLGLVRQVDAQTFEGLDPAIALENLISLEIARLRDQVGRLDACRSRIGPLYEDFTAAAPRGTRPDVQHVQGLDRVREKLDELAFFARREIMGLQPSGPWSPETISAARPLDLRCLRRGVRMRTVVRAEILDDERTRSYLLDLCAHGAEVRTAEGGRLERLILFDRTVFVAPIDAEDSKRGAVVVSRPGQVANMVSLFERVWRQATPVGAADPTARAGLSTTEKQVLAILCQADKDELGAREMGVSVRTFRKHVADVMAKLGAANRFQTALLAKERGWI